MRVYFHLSPNTRIVPFNYQHSLVGAFHKWLGHNELHDDISLYSLSWLSKGQARGKKGLDFPNGSTFQVSAPDRGLLHDLVQGVFEGHLVNWGMKVGEMTIQRTPDFGESHRFVVESPVLVKRRRMEGKHDQYYFPGDPDTDTFLTETLRNKLRRAQLDDSVVVRFDPDYSNPRIKMITFKGVDIKATYCPVIVEGNARAVQFAWETGVGNSTGAGFGALR